MTRGRRWMAGALAAIAVVSIAAVAVWSARSEIARWFLVRQIEALTSRRATVGRVEIDLAHGRLVMTGLRLDDREPGPPLAELDRLDVRVDLRALLGRHVWIREAMLGGVRVRIVRSEGGVFNIADLLRRGEQQAGAGALTIDRLALRDGVVALEDRARAPARAWRAEGIALELTGLSSRRADTTGAARLTATVAGAPLTLEVADVRLDPLHLRVQIETTDLDATLASVALPSDVTAVLEQAHLSAGVTAVIDARDGVRLDTRGRLTDLAVRSTRTGDPLLAVPSLAFTVDGARIDASAATSRPGRIEVIGTATVFDARGQSAERLGVDEIRLLVEGDGGGASARISLSATMAGGGDLDIQGPVRLAPLGAELRVRITGLSPTVLASHAALPVSLAGALDADLNVDLAAPVDRGAPRSGGAGALIARARGRATVKRAVAAGRGQQVAIARQVEAEGIDVEWPRIGIARIRVTQPVAVVERDQSGHIPVAALLAEARAPGGDATTPVPSPAPRTAVTVEIGEIAVDDGTLTLDDATATPAARLTLSRLRMSVRDAVWPPRAPMPIAVNAATPGSGTVEATGTLALDPLRVDVRARVGAAALSPYQGYVPFRARLDGQLHADLAVTGTLAPRTEVTARGTAAVSDLSMTGGDRPVIRVARIETAGLHYTWPSTLTVDRLHVRGSRLRAVRQADGAFPLRALFSVARDPGAGANAKPAAGRDAGTSPGGPAVRNAASASPGRDAAPAQISVLVREALLEDGRARLVDESVAPAARVDLTGVRLAAKDFTWPARAPLPIDFAMSTPGGGTVHARGTLDLAGAGADIKLTLSAVDLSAAQPYLPVSGRVTGKASADLDVKATREPLAITARGTASVADVALADDGRPAITAARVETTGVDFAWPGRIAIDRLRVQAPRAAVRRRSDGSLSIIDLLGGRRQASGGTPLPSSPSSPATPPTSPLAISVQESVVEDATVAVTDATVNPAARFEVTGIRLTARDLTWPSRGPIPIDLRASMPGGGAAGATGRVAQDLSRLDLDVTLTGVDIAVVRPYLPVRGRLSGKASAKLAVDATFSPLAIAARGSASVADLVVADGERRLLTAGHTEVTGLDYAWPAAVDIDQLHVRKSWALIDRVAGNLPVLEALTTAAPPPPARERRGTRSGNRGAGRPDRSPARAERPARQSDTAAPGQSAALQMTVRQTLIEDSSTTILDASVTPPARLEIVGARLVVRALTWPARGPTDVSLRASTPTAGAIEAHGQLRLDAPAIDTRLVLDGVDVAALQPLIPVRARLGGKASADLQITGTLVPLALTATGTAALADAELGDGQRSLVRAKRVGLTGLTAEWPRRRATVERVTVSEPWALVEREAGGELPLLALLSATPEAPGGARPAPAPGGATTTSKREDAPRVQIGALSVEDGFVRFTDRTPRPAFVEEASRLTVTARDLSTEPSARSEVVVNARLTGGAQVELRGHMGPIGGPLFADAQGQLSDLALNRVNPYVNGLLGWVARRGSVSATTRFRIRDDRLEADNEIVIGQPLFVPSRSGDEVRKRVGVPLDLLVSLLENARREVHLSVPVTGNLSSREFDFGDAVWNAIRAAAIKVLALPVSWIGKIFYTADARIDSIAIWPVYFEAGTTRFEKGFDAHAERLSAFMRQTPSIVYALKPVMTVADVQALKRDAVRRRLQTLARESGQSDVAAAAKLFAERFPERPAPAGLDAALDALAQDEPAPEAALRALAAARLEVTRRQLESKGVDGTRLRTSDAIAPVEASGAGRVEFEMIPDAGETASRG